MRTGFVVEDSDRRCPHDSKRMIVEIGQDDDGWTRRVHECLHCGYAEREAVQPQPLPTRVGKLAERLRAARIGEPVRVLVWDSTAGVLRPLTPEPELTGPRLLCPRCPHAEPLGGDRLEARARMYRHCEDSHTDEIPWVLERQATEVSDADRG